RPDGQKGSLLGPSFSDDAIRGYLDDAGAQYTWMNEDELLDVVTRAIADGKIVGWYQGRMEFGPRALGARSILGDARSPRMQAIMNLKIKFRESFRPFAPSVLRECADSWFVLPPDSESPYMLLVADVGSNHRVDLSEEDQ